MVKLSCGNLRNRVVIKRKIKIETQRILVTGGGGFIGANLVKELKKRGHEVIASDLYNTDSDRNDYIRADVRNYRQLERVFEIEKRKFDFVYHLAAEYGTARITMRTCGQPMLSERSI